MKYKGNAGPFFYLVMCSTIIPNPWFTQVIVLSIVLSVSTLNTSIPYSRVSLNRKTGKTCTVSNDQD